jgi:acetyl-CoA carboxylase biotin carboxyl carrier protein
MSDRQPIVELDFLRGLIAAVDESGIDSLDVSRGGTRIRISKSAPTAIGSGGAAAQNSAPAPAHDVRLPTPAAQGTAEAAPSADAAAPEAPDTGNLVDIKSPMVGTFYRSPAPEAPSYVEVGSRVTKGQTLCILEAMKLMNELEAEVAGTVREIVVENSEPVEYGQVLFRIEPDA